MKTKRGAVGVARAMLVLMGLAFGGLAPAELTHPFNVMDLDGRNGVRINSGDLYPYYNPSVSYLSVNVGLKVTGIGDTNGDGFEDAAVSMRGEKSGVTIGVYPPAVSIDVHRGRVNVVLGQNEGWYQGVESLEYLIGNRGFWMEGIDKTSELGMRVLAGVGDINGDGYSDFIANSDGFPGNQKERASYLIFGMSQQDFQISDSETETIGTVRFYRIHRYIERTLSAGGIGDVNGDGYDDLLFWYSDLNGTDAFNGMLVYGRGEGWPGLVRLGEEIEEIEQTPLVGGFDLLENDYDYLSKMPDVTGLGDVNGDGLDDFALGFPSIGSLGEDVGGSIYVVYGSRSGFGEVLDLEALDGRNGFRMDDSGGRVKSVGDVVVDGRNDFVVGTAGFIPEELAGATEKQYGRVRLFSHPSMPDSDPVVDGTDCFITEIIGRAGDAAGTSFGLWSYDSNGAPILAIGAPGSFRYHTDPGGRGAAFLLHYEANRLASPLNLQEFDEQHGVRLDGAMRYDRLGVSISSGFDFDGDGNLDGVVSAPHARDYEGEMYLVYGDDGPTSLTIRRYIAPGDAPRAGVGMLGDGSHTIPHSRLWIDFGSGDDGSGNASLMTATIRRNLDGLSNLPGPAASVHWIGEWDRPGWDGANITLKYLDSEVAGLNPARLRLYYSETPDGPWTESQHPLIDTRKKRIGGVVWSKGYYVLIEKPLASGDVNKDGGVTPADAEDAFDCSIGACPPGADMDSADICPPGGDGFVTAGDAQGIFQRWLGLTPCE